MPTCPPKIKLEKRDLLSTDQASDLEELFKILANDTRLKLLHSLIRSKEMCVSDLCEVLSMKPQALSNQLQRLQDKGIVESRRDGNQIHYQIIDPCISSLIDLGICLLEDLKGKKR